MSQCIKCLLNEPVKTKHRSILKTKFDENEVQFRQVSLYIKFFISGLQHIVGSKSSTVLTMGNHVIHSFKINIGFSYKIQNIYVLIDIRYEYILSNTS